MVGENLLPGLGKEADKFILGQNLTLMTSYAVRILLRWTHGQRMPMPTVLSIRVYCLTQSWFTVTAVQNLNPVTSVLDEDPEVP